MDRVTLDVIALQQGLCGNTPISDHRSSNNGDTDPAAEAGGLFGSSTQGFFYHARNYLTGSAASGLIGVAGIAILARLMTPAEYGTWAVFLSLVPMLVMAVEWNLRSALKRYAMEPEGDVSGYVRTISAFTLLTAGIGLALGLGAAMWLSPDEGLTRAVITLLLFATVLQVPWALYSQLLVGRQQSAYLARLRVLRDALLLVGAVTGASVATSAQFGAQSEGAIAGWAVVSGGFAILIGRRLLIDSFGGVLRGAHLRHALLYALPLMPHLLAQLSLHGLDRLVVHQLEGPAAAALYSVAYSVAAVLSVVVAATGQAWLPVFVEHCRAGRQADIRKTVASYALDIAAAALLVTVLARELIGVLAGSDWLPAATVVPFVVFGYAGLFVAQVYANYALWLQRSIWVAMPAVVCAAMNLAANYLLVPLYGYAAAAWTTFGCYWLLALLNFAIARTVLRQSVVPFWVACRPIAALGALGAAYAIASNSFVDAFAFVLTAKILLAGLAAAVFAREEIVKRWTR